MKYVLIVINGRDKSTKTFILISKISIISFLLKVEVLKIFWALNTEIV